jgi:hypothetical protein
MLNRIKLHATVRMFPPEAGVHYGRRIPEE